MTDYRDLSGFFSEARYVRALIRTQSTIDAAWLRFLKNMQTVHPSDPECAAFYRKPCTQQDRFQAHINRMLEGLEQDRTRFALRRDFRIGTAANPC